MAIPLVADKVVRICLITSAHLASNPRLVKEADALSEGGYGVTVIASTSTRRGREGDRTFATRPWRVEAPLPFGPDAPRGRRVLQLARLHVARAMVRAGLRCPALLSAGFHPVTPDLTHLATRVEADLYIAHLAALPAAANAARRRGALYAFDAEDYHPGELRDGPGTEIQRRTTAAIERTYLPGCSYVTAASPGIADAYAETYGIPRPTVILNVFPRSQAPVAATVRGSAEPGPSIYWFSQTIGPDRGLETTVCAVALATIRPHLYLRGAPSAGFADKLMDLARLKGVADRIHLLDPSPPDEMSRLASAFDIGVSAEPGFSVNNRIALGNKLFSYLLAGLPIVASDVPAHRHFASRMEGAMRLFNVGNAKSQAEAIDALLSSDAALAAARSAAFRLGQERFNWDVEKRILLDEVSRAFKERRRVTAFGRE